MERLVEVAIPMPLPQTFTYRADETAALGHRVLVPFGRRTVTGYIVGDAAPTSEHAIKPVLAVLDDLPLLNPPLLELAQQMRDTYGCAFGEAIQTLLPAGLVSQSRRRVFANGHLPDPIEPAARALYAKIRSSSGLDFSTLVKKAPAAFYLLRSLERSGHLRIESILGGRRAVEQKDLFYRLAPGAQRPRGAIQAALFDFLSDRSEPAPRIELVDRGYAAAILALTKKGVIERIERARTYAAPSSFAHAPNVTLSTEQSAAVAGIERALDGKTAEKFLLFGVTGSGKTEVYLRATAHALSKGRTVLALVPEIALTPQFVGRFRARFGDRISVLHSARSESERLTEWKRIRRGEADIVIGARGAVFAPLENIGLIIIDEEHDASYKQEDGIPYHAKHLAYFRARRESAAVLLGSATPSMESFSLAKEGKLKLLPLRQRIGHFGLPRVDIVDLRKEFSRFGEKGLLSTTLREALTDTLLKGEQAVLFLNRRGFAPMLLCPSCGETLQCPECSVSLTYHRDQDALVCHYCDLRRSPKSPCMSCGQKSLVQLGIGTERMEQELRFYFPDAAISRMDRDTTQGKGEHERILKDFAAGKTDVLLGTQMVTKGLDVENVTLVGVLLADQSLHFPDFRAAETTFQLLTQVAGRAGRGTKAGRAIFQTFLPDHYTLVAAQSQDYEGFFEREISFRRELRYPPFSSLALIELSDPSEPTVRNLAIWMQRQARAQVEKKPEWKISILGPAPCPIKKIQGRYRYQLLVKSERGGAAAPFAKWLVERTSEQAPKASIRLNVDPYRFM